MGYLLDRPIGSFLSLITSLNSKQMSDLEVWAVPTAAYIGRPVPTETGLRLFVDGLMEFNRDLQYYENPLSTASAPRVESA